MGFIQKGEQLVVAVNGLAKIKGVVEVIEVVIGYGVKIIGIAKNHIVKAVILQKCHPFNA